MQKPASRIPLKSIFFTLTESRDRSRLNRPFASWPDADVAAILMAAIAPARLPAASLVERNAGAIVRTPGLAAELRTIIGECQAPAWVADPARYAEMMRKRSSRAGDFHAKVCDSLDRAESAELKRGFAARKGG
jgi:hypothetical protein